MAPARLKNDNVGKVYSDPVEVLCRVRPAVDLSVPPCITIIDKRTIELAQSDTLKQGLNAVKATQCTFTEVFDEEAPQDYVFHRVGLQLVEDLIRGKNGLLFTYGVTGSGKTYSMTGTPKDQGILPRCLDVLFNCIGNVQAGKFVFTSNGFNGFSVQTEAAAEQDRQRERAQQQTFAIKTPSAAPKTPLAGKRDGLDWELVPRERVTLEIAVPDIEDNAYSVFVSYVEIYNNYVYDLLDPDAGKGTKPQSKLLREDTCRMMFVYGVTEVEVTSTDEAFDVFIKGQRNRRVAHTQLNTESSRSHSVFTIRVVQAPLDHNGIDVLQDSSKVHVSMLSLVDLAGSERAARTGHMGDRAKEAGYINNSLMCLRNCIATLRENQISGTNEMVPYRYSKLTHLFKNFFDGEGKVRMMVCINPTWTDFEENQHVVQFAEMTQEVEVFRGNTVQQPEVTDLTPGRRRAAQLYKERTAAAADKISALPTVPSYPLLNGLRPSVQITAPDDDMTVSKLVEYYAERVRLMHDFRGDLSRKGVHFEDDLKKVLCQHDALKIKYADTHRQMVAAEQESMNLRDTVKALRQENSSLAVRLGKYENDVRSKVNREEQFKRKEGELHAKLRCREDKLRRVKELVEFGAAPAALSKNIGSLEDICAGSGGKGPVTRGAAASGGLYPTLVPSTPMKGDSGRMKRRAPSPPPKPVGFVPIHHVRNHRRSKSGGFVVNENIGFMGAGGPTTGFDRLRQGESRKRRSSETTDDDAAKKATRF